MNRRSFFTSAGLLVAGASVGLFIPKFEPVKWKVEPVRIQWVLNPEYANAPYEMGVVDANGIYAEHIHPLRYRRNAKGGYDQVPYLILA